MAGTIQNVSGQVLFVPEVPTTVEPEGVVRVEDPERYAEQRDTWRVVPESKPAPVVAPKAPESKPADKSADPVPPASAPAAPAK